jgi:2-polyprenyl-6-methoxyphenol hydroxylase-like FAD-dependent oxidoreductase
MNGDPTLQSAQSPASLIEGAHLLTTQRHAVVIGAGIAGTATALFLRRIGWQVTLAEARPATDDGLGSYFSVADNGRSVLASLGLSDALAAAGTPTETITFHAASGTQLGANPAPTVLIRRDRLARVLRRAARRSGVHLRHDTRLSDLDQIGDGVVARFADGTTLAGDLLVGADGVHSRTRRLLFPGHPAPGFTGIIDGGGQAGPLPGVAADRVLRLTFGTRAFFGHQALPDGGIVWFQSLRVARTDHAAPRAEPAGAWRDRLLDLHADDHAPIPDIIAATDGPIVRWPVHQLDTPPSWHAGRVMLIGDAVHAMEPHDGQSASMALEDAVTLARCLRDSRSITAALAECQRQRAERVAEVAALAHRTGSLKFPGEGRERRARDAVLAMFLRSGVDASTQVSRHRIAWPGPPPRPDIDRR